MPQAKRASRMRRFWRYLNKECTNGEASLLDLVEEDLAGAPAFSTFEVGKVYTVVMDTVFKWRFSDMVDDMFRDWEEPSPIMLAWADRFENAAKRIRRMHAKLAKESA